MTGPDDMWEVDVPIRHRADGRTGVHVFAGPATDSAAALAHARRVYNEALEHVQHGREIPFPEQTRWAWAARGLRPDFELQWKEAQVHEVDFVL
ncbi:hypothetical protein [Streptomyces sasae]|uniref:hypothetical protein n=1 Tax=Streptomyces sasae TaxID=1266772 RepID=UPI00292E4A42|nr:hypothetical protein [Streptomyces sasae]